MVFFNLVPRIHSKLDLRTVALAAVLLSALLLAATAGSASAADSPTPIRECVRLPIIGRLGQRVSWLLFSGVLVMAAVLPWQFFSSALSESANSLVSNSNLISKIYFPRIIIPAGADSDKGGKRGVVVALGPGRTEDGKLMKPSVKEGDKVIFQWGDKVRLGEDDYYIVRESEILAVIK